MVSKFKKGQLVKVTNIPDCYQRHHKDISFGTKCLVLGEVVFDESNTVSVKIYETGKLSIRIVPYFSRSKKGIVEIRITCTNGWEYFVDKKPQKY